MSIVHDIKLTKPNDPFTTAHIFLTLKLIAKELVLGRYEIEKQLELSNSATRTMLKRLKIKGLIKPIKRKGHCLTENGKHLLKAITQRLPFCDPLPLPGLIPEPDYLVQIVKPLIKSKNGILERDFAVRHGAKGGISIHYLDKQLQLPGVTKNLSDNYTEAALIIREKISLNEGDVIFAAFADSLLTAAIAAIEVGFWLLD
ncbi:MAG: DUF4443 domain-containing protein [Candidatus Ranarchaeia archaeon]